MSIATALPVQDLKNFGKLKLCAWRIPDDISMHLQNKKIVFLYDFRRSFSIDCFIFVSSTYKRRYSISKAYIAAQHISILHVLLQKNFGAKSLSFTSN
jgi:hypothetical protein